MKAVVRSFCIVLLFSVAATSFADGGGGLFVGYQMAQYPLLEQYPITNNNFGLAYYGGYGYGVSYNMSKFFTGGRYHRSDFLNTIAGGFGYVIMDSENPENIIGGFGGVISGLRIIKAPLSVSVMSYTGFGGMGIGKAYADGPAGFFCVSQEITAEVGIPLSDWFMPTVYAGYQVIGNVIPGVMFDSFLSYTPVMGVRIQFGDFL